MIWPRSDNSQSVEQENMPILIDIMDHGAIGPAIRQGRREGKLEEASAIAQRLLSARFGPLSPATKKRVAKLTLP